MEQQHRRAIRRPILRIADIENARLDLPEASRRVGGRRTRLGAGAADRTELSKGCSEP